MERDTPLKGISAGGHAGTVRRSRLVCLDFLRTVAIGLVLGCHLQFLPSNPDVTSPLLLALEAWGWVGVDLFFALSGFLVSGLLFAELRKFGNVSLGRFLLRRGLKIYPLFYALLLVTLVVGGCNGSLELSRLLVEASFLQGYFIHEWAHTWSLAVEEHFYLLLAAVVLWAQRGNGARRVAGFFLGVLVFEIGLRASLADSVEDNYFRSFLRMDSLGYGVIAAYVFHFHPRWRPGARTAAVGVALVTVALCFVVPVCANTMSVWVNTLGLSALGLLFSLLVFFCVSGERSAAKPREWRLVRVFGQASYAIYLLHLPVMRYGVRQIHDRYPISFEWQAVLYLGLTTGLGVWISTTLEAAILRWRDRRFPARGIEMEQSACYSCPTKSRMRA